MYYLLRSTSEGLIVLFSLVYFLNYHFYLEEDFGLYNPDELIFKQLFIKKYNPTWWEIWETHWMIVWDFGGFPGDAGGKESTCQSRRCKRLGLSPRGAHGNPLQYSCLENPVDRRAWRGYSPWGCKDSDPTERLSIHTCRLGGSAPFSRLSGR